MANSNSTKDFYVYVHRKATTGQIFYVGKGHGDRLKWTHSRSKFWNSIVKKHGFTYEVIADNLQEWYAFEIEKEIILFYGRENLCNLTDGGDGPSGAKRTEETKKKISISKSGENHFCFGKFGKDSPSFGRVASAETKKKMSIARLGCKHHFFGVKDDKHQNAKKIKCVELDITFGSGTLAIKWLIDNVNKKAVYGHLSEVATGKRKKAYGYTWHHV